MKMKHDNLWRANPDTAEEMDEIERRRKRAMRQAAAMLLNTQIPANVRTPFMGTVKTCLLYTSDAADD